MTDQAPAEAPAEPASVRGRFGFVVSVAAVVLALDQLTKSWASSTLADRDIDIVGSLRFHLVRNSGSAFSLNEGRGGLIAILALVVVGVLLWMGRTSTTVVGALSLGMVLGGALGNLADRLLRDGSAVVDFIDLQWYPIFNVADIGVSIGGVLLVLASFRE